MDYVIKTVDARTGKPLKDNPEVSKIFCGLTEERLKHIAIGWVCGLKSKFKHPEVRVYDANGVLVHSVR